jgi:hypothetical protein
MASGIGDHSVALMAVEDASGYELCITAAAAALYSVALLNSTQNVRYLYDMPA